MELAYTICVLVIVAIIFWKSTSIRKDGTIGIIDKKQQTAIRAICCIIVVLVHIPENHGNFIQDLIGSFGYIAVTLFFMMSSYGLKYSVENKENYLKNFWKNRILILLIPFWIANFISMVIRPSESILHNVMTVLGINNISFVTVLLGYYIVFWLIYKFIKNKKIKDYILCAIVLTYSLVGKIFNFQIGWQVESIGFIYGILAYNILAKVKDNNAKFIISIVTSLILGILYLKYKEIYMIGTWLLRVVLGLSVISTVYFLLNKIEIEGKIIKYIGNISYEIFLVHTIAMSLIAKVNIPSSFWITLTFIITIVLATILKFIDTKIIKLIRKEEVSR